MEVKYFKELSLSQIATRTENAYRELSYLDVVDALANIEEVCHTREPLVKEARKLIDKTDLTPFEAVFMMMCFKDLQANIKLGGDDD